MPCTDIRRRLERLALLTGITVLLAGCGNRQAPVAAPPSPAARAAQAPAAEPGVAGPVPAAEPGVAAPAPAARVTPAPALRLPVPDRPRNMKDLQLQFARRLVAAHPGSSYSGRAPDRLLAIPVLEVELHADGSVRRIEVLRRPTTDSEATALAIAAVRRAAPYGDVSRLPRPWKVVETFLFDDRLYFKPRTLDVD